MVVLIIILFLIFLYYKIQKNKYGEFSAKGRRNLLIFSGLLIILQSGLRNFAIGADTYAYYEIFNDIRFLSWEEILLNFKDSYISGEGKDPGYTILQKIFQELIPDYRCFLIFVISIFIHSIFRLIYKYKISLSGILVSISLYYALFYSFFSITGIRQTIVTAIALYVVPYAISRKPIKFFIPILFAATIHKSILIFTIFYFFPLLKNGNRVLFFAFLSFIPMYIFGQSIGKYIIANTIFNTYESYLDGNYSTNGAIGFAIFIVFFGFLCLKYMKIVGENSRWTTFINAVAFSIFYTPMTAIGPSQMRIIQYFSIFLLFLFPQIVKEVFSQYGKFKNFELLAFLFFSLYAIMRKPIYSFFWEPTYLGDNYISYFNAISGW